MPREKLTFLLCLDSLDNSTQSSINITESVLVVCLGGVRKSSVLLLTKDSKYILSESSSTIPNTSSASKFADKSLTVESKFLSSNLQRNDLIENNGFL